MAFGDQEYRDNPYPTLAQLRATDPVHRDAYGIWILTRHDDITKVHADSRFGRDYKMWRDYALLRPFMAGSALEASVERWFFFRDPPDHTRLRRLAARALAFSGATRKRAAASSVVDTLLARLHDQHEIEFMSDFARVVPVHLIGDLMGLPIDDLPLLQRWASELTAVFEPSRPLSERKTADTANAHLHSYLRNAVAYRRTHNTDDLISALMEADPSPPHDYADDVIEILVLLIIAAVETTSNLLGNGMFALVTHPDQLDSLAGDPSLIQRAVEEMLRFEAPASLNTRVALTPVSLRGKNIGEGDLVFCMLAAANRDPNVFSKPDDVDITRHPNPHVAFGGGGHHCLGASLARLEGEVAFTRLLRYWRNIELLTSHVQWRPFINLRGLERLQLRVSTHLRH